AIIGLAHSLGLEVVAEGVESGDQWEYFRARSCRTLQGFHFNRPVPRQEVPQLLEKRYLAAPRAVEPLVAPEAEGRRVETTPAETPAEETTASGPRAGDALPE
ncbi:MAG: EAL domain-containing protein, partial [Spirochaetaceae bacterium]